MHYRNLMIVAIVAPALIAGACNRRGESRDSVVRDGAASTADEATKAQQQRDEDISRLDTRVAEIEREYTDANQKVAEDRKTPAPGLKAELKEDVTQVKQAVSDLRSTTPENWWARHEAALKRTADDIDADVVRGGPNGDLSLSAARANYRSLGASSPRFIKSVRRALPGELP